MYKVCKIGVLRTADNAWIPNDARNMDWLAYKSWLSAGNKPLPADTGQERTLLAEEQ